MGVHMVDKADLKEIISLCNYLYDKDSAIAKRRNLNINEVYRNGRTRKPAIVLDYTQKSYYSTISKMKTNFDGYKSFPENSYNLFCEKFEELLKDEKIIKTEKDIEYQDRFNALKGKIEVQSEDNNRNKTGTIVDQFVSSRWRIYQQQGKKIIVRNLEFLLMTKGRIEVDEGNIDERLPSYKGEAYVSKKNQFLIIQTRENNDGNEPPRNYMLMIDSYAMKIKYCLGTLTYFEQKINNILTDTILLQEDRHGRKKPVETYNIYDPQTPNNIGEEIFYFLNYNAFGNHSFLKPFTVSDDVTLKDWRIENNEKKKKNFPKAIFGNYLTYYKSVEKIEKHYLRIKQDKNGDVLAVFNNKPPGSDQTIRWWVGNLMYSSSSNSLFASLKGPLIEYNENTNHAFLILNLPIGENPFSAMSGVISGLSTNYHGAVSMVILTVRVDSEVDTGELSYDDFMRKALEKEDNTNKVISFFENSEKSSYIYPPYPRISSIDDLN